MSKVCPIEQEKQFKRILKKPLNNQCADCGGNAPSWISLGFGVFVCMNCSGSHRAMGQNITRVRSIRLDGLTQEDIDIMDMVGNEMANQYWECRLQVQQKPQPSTSLDDLKRFVQHKYIKKMWAQVGLVDPQTGYSQSLISGIPFNQPKPKQVAHQIKQTNNSLKEFYSDNGSMPKNWKDDPTIKFKTTSGIPQVDLISPPSFKSSNGGQIDLFASWNISEMSSQPSKSPIPAPTASLMPWDSPQITAVVEPKIDWQNAFQSQPQTINDKNQQNLNINNQQVLSTSQSHTQINTQFTQQNQPIIKMDLHKQHSLPQNQQQQNFNYPQPQNEVQKQNSYPTNYHQNSQNYYHQNIQSNTPAQQTQQDFYSYSFQQKAVDSNTQNQPNQYANFNTHQQNSTQNQHNFNTYQQNNTQNQHNFNAHQQNSTQNQHNFNTHQQQNQQNQQNQQPANFTSNSFKQQVPVKQKVMDQFTNNPFANPPPTNVMNLYQKDFF